MFNVLTVVFRHPHAKFVEKEMCSFLHDNSWTPHPFLWQQSEPKVTVVYKSMEVAIVFAHTNPEIHWLQTNTNWSICFWGLWTKEMWSFTIMFWGCIGSRSVINPNPISVFSTRFYIRLFCQQPWVLFRAGPQEPPDMLLFATVYLLCSCFSTMTLHYPLYKLLRLCPGNVLPSFLLH